MKIIGQVAQARNIRLPDYEFPASCTARRTECGKPNFATRLWASIV